MIKQKPRWRVGRKVPINVYMDDKPVCQCHSEKMAKHIVDALNWYESYAHYAIGSADIDIEPK